MPSLCATDLIYKFCKLPKKRNTYFSCCRKSKLSDNLHTGYLAVKTAGCVTIDENESGIAVTYMRHMKQHHRVDSYFICL